ncbi:hypothetical protein BH23GEM6_BH23GEM6_26100 [soil metagenome]
MRKIVLVAVVALLMAPVGLQAQRADQAEQRIQAAQARVAEARIPAELLEARIAEGRAKGLTEERVAMIAERRAAGLIRAQEALAGNGRSSSAAEIGAGAEALDKGADGNALRAVIQQARDDDASVALAVLGELAGQGMPVGQALERVTAAMARGGDALANLPQQAVAARERRGRPEGAGRPATAGRAAGAGNAPVGPPSGVPAAGSRPGGGPPAGTPATGRPARP